MELFAAIRRDAAGEELSIRELADRHHVHRRTVRQALASAIPPPRKTPVADRRGGWSRSSRLIDAMLRSRSGRAEEAAAYRPAGVGPAGRRARRGRACRTRRCVTMSRSGARRSGGGGPVDRESGVRAADP